MPPYVLVTDDCLRALFRLSIVTVLRQTDIYYAVSSPMWILVAMVKVVARTFTR